MSSFKKDLWAVKESFTMDSMNSNYLKAMANIMIDFEDGTIDSDTFFERSGEIMDAKDTVATMLKHLA